MHMSVQCTPTLSSLQKRCSCLPYSKRWKIGLQCCWVSRVFNNYICVIFIRLNIHSSFLYCFFFLLVVRCNRTPIIVCSTLLIECVRTGRNCNSRVWPYLDIYSDDIFVLKEIVQNDLFNLRVNSFNNFKFPITNLCWVFLSNGSSRCVQIKKNPIKTTAITDYREFSKIASDVTANCSF